MIENEQFSSICKTLQLLCRVRGFKHIAKLFPHEVHQLELCILLLRTQVHYSVYLSLFINFLIT